MAKLETISETASPAPWRLACRRTNQLPIPASGASTTRFGIGIPPSVQGSVSERFTLPRVSGVVVIFDCDGVLVDSEPLSNAALAEALRMAGLEWSVEQTTAEFKGRSWASC